MALIHKATLTPSKLDLLITWLPSRPWFGSGSHDALDKLGSYRLDDPAGEVGLEAFILRDGAGRTVHVPLTYRADPLPNGEKFLVGTTEHSVLGKRWVYDGCGDPVWVSQLATAILSGGHQAEENVEDDGRLVPREPTMTVTGSGTADINLAVPDSVQPVDDGPVTVARVGDHKLVTTRIVGAGVGAGETLTGRWVNGEATLAAVSPASSPAN